MKSVLIVMGSAHDAPAVKPAGEVLKSFGVPFSACVMSAHRTPQDVRELAENAREQNVGVIIAAAGMAAHLAGVIAAATTLPVIGVPLKASSLNGVDALLSTVMMPPGIPVACVGVDGAKNAAVLATEILSLSQPDLVEALATYRKTQADAVISANTNLDF